MSEQIEYWVQRRWPTIEKDFKDTIKCDSPEDAVTYRDLESRRLGNTEHRAIKRTITEEVL